MNKNLLQITVLAIIGGITFFLLSHFVSNTAEGSYRLGLEKTAQSVIQEIKKTGSLKVNTGDEVVELIIKNDKK